MSNKIMEITGTVTEAGKLSTCSLINPLGVRLDVKGEPVEFHGLDKHEVRALGMLLGKEVTLTITTEEPLPGLSTT